MQTTETIKSKLRKVFDDKQASALAETIHDANRDVVRVGDFNELKGIVKELAEAQKRTAVKIEELAGAQNRTEGIVEELAVAQKKTEEELRSLVKTVKNVQKELGGLSHTIGYALEDSIYPVLPKLLKEDFGIKTKGQIARRFIEYPDGRDDEVNIYGEGELKGKKVYIIGEAKAQLGKGDVEAFAGMLKRIKKHLEKDLVALFLCYMVHPRVERYIAEKHPDIKIYKSYEIQRRAKSSAR